MNLAEHISDWCLPVKIPTDLRNWLTWIMTHGKVLSLALDLSLKFNNHELTIDVSEFDAFYCHFVFSFFVSPATTKLRKLGKRK